MNGNNVGRKGSSQNISRASVNRRNNTISENRSTIVRGEGPPPGPPKKNASNNVNGDETFKVHTVHGDFKCPEPNCIACTYQVKSYAAKQIEK